MQMDYLLDHFGSQILETEQAKVEFFHKKLGAPLEALPQVSFKARDDGKVSTRYFLDRFPIAVEQSSPSMSSLRVSFAFIDDGSRTVTAFAHYLKRIVPLLRFIPEVEVIYVADSERNFVAAERVFEQVFPNHPAAAQQNSDTYPCGTSPRQSMVRLRGHLLTYSYPIWSPRYRGIGL